jgi:sigma-E factor negative regulatory protein RseC
MKQSGTVLRLDGEMALITGERASTCGSCAGKSSCSTLGAWNQRSLELLVYNDLGAKVGDEVMIEVPDSLVLKSAYRLYGLPMLLFFAAGILAYVTSHYFGVGQPDLWAALSGLAAVIIYYLSGAFNTRGEEGLDAHIVQIQTQPSTYVEIDCPKR